MESIIVFTKRVDPNVAGIFFVVQDIIKYNTEPELNRLKSLTFIIKGMKKIIFYDATLKTPKHYEYKYIDNMSIQNENNTVTLNFNGYNGSTLTINKDLFVLSDFNQYKKSSHDGGAPKNHIHILGRKRLVTRVGRTQFINHLGSQISITQARLLQRQRNQDKDKQKKNKH